MNYNSFYNPCHGSGMESKKLMPLHKKMYFNWNNPLSLIPGSDRCLRTMMNPSMKEVLWVY